MQFRALKGGGCLVRISIHVAWLFVNRFRATVTISSRGRSVGKAVVVWICGLPNGRRECTCEQRDNRPALAGMRVARPQGNGCALLETVRHFPVREKKARSARSAHSIWCYFMNASFFRFGTVGWKQQSPTSISRELWEGSGIENLRSPTSFGSVSETWIRNHLQARPYLLLRRTMKENDEEDCN